MNAKVWQVWKQKCMDKIFKHILFPGSEMPDYIELKFTPIPWNICSQPLSKPRTLKAAGAQGHFC